MDYTTLSPELEERVQRAVDNFMQGYGCCQSVVAAFADIYGLSDDLAKRIAAGFGGGVGRLRMMCGGFGDIASTEDNTTGQIGGNTEVYMCGAFTHGDVFGGSAGLEPKTA